MDSSINKVRDTLIDLLVYLDGNDSYQGGNQSSVSPLEKFIQYHRKLGVECSLLQAFVYSLLTRKEAWERLGALFDALYEYGNSLRGGRRE